MAGAIFCCCYIGNGEVELCDIDVSERNVFLIYY
jgi:hypothetical protein